MPGVSELTEFITKIEQFENYLPWLRYIPSQIPEASKDPSELDIGLLNQRLHEVERKINILQDKLNIRDSSDIEIIVKQTFIRMPTIKGLHIRSTQSGFILIVIHNSKTISDAIGQIQPRLAKLEDEFPDVYFEPRIIHSRDVQEEQLRHSKTIFKK